MSPLRKMTRGVAYRVLPRYLEKRHRNRLNSRCNIIVSFTSFPARINNVWQVVECMKRQTCKPAKILLWLSKDQFPTKESIPQSLYKREDDTFEIRMVDGDLRSHKKYYYVSKEFPDSLVFLIDDDIYYSSNLLERTMKAHEKNPHAVICNYGYLMTFQAEGKLNPYRKWKHNYSNSTSSQLFFGSGGGTLFRPSELYCDLTNIEKARQLTPLADDIWLNAMVRLADRPIVMLKHGLFLEVDNDKNVRLATENYSQDKNDEQLSNIIEYYHKKNGFSLFCKNLLV